MSKWSKIHQPCPCGSSSDAYSEDHTGGGYCFSCAKSFQGSEDLDDKTYSYQYLPLRGLTEDTVKRYQILHQINSDGKPRAVAFDYGGGARKIRFLDAKKFVTEGPISTAGLFGKGLFSAGSARSITITEGELDAPSVFQMLGSKYPAVSVQSSSSAKRDCVQDRDYLNSFERIYLCLDNDEPGQKATLEIAQLFDFNKVYHVKLSKFKDANEYLTNAAVEEFRHTWYNARRFIPEGVVSSYQEIDNILDNATTKPSVALPFPTLQEMTDGLRTGEIALFTALEGVGKTEVLRAIEYKLLKDTDHKVGIIHLEEKKERIIKGFAGLELGVPAHLREGGVSLDEIKSAYRDLSKFDDRIHIYSHFGSDDPNAILDTIRFLVVACGCKFIFLDHLTMVVSGLQTDDERKALDYMSTRLAMMCVELDFNLCLVSHVNDDGLTRGSRNISKVANVWIHLDRDLQNEEDFIRNVTHLVIRKNRETGRTGPAGRLIFNPETFSLRELSKELPT